MAVSSLMLGVDQCEIGLDCALDHLKSLHTLGCSCMCVPYKNNNNVAEPQANSLKCF